jgi:molecular chaperone IbpA
MQNINFDPLWRTTVGFDRLFSLMDENLRLEPEDHYPPYDIIRTGEDRYRISLAVAGFPPEQINITAQQNALTVAGRLPEREEKTQFLYRGIVGRPFERRFNLADFVEVERASLSDGLLVIDLVKRVPEAMKPRRIEIDVKKEPAERASSKTIEHLKAADKSAA